MVSDFRSDDSFPVKLEVAVQQWLTPHSTRNTRLTLEFWQSQTYKTSFIGKKLAENRVLKSVVNMLKWKLMTGFLMNVLETLYLERQLPVLSPENLFKSVQFSVKK